RAPAHRRVPGDYCVYSRGRIPVSFDEQARRVRFGFGADPCYRGLVDHLTRLQGERLRGAGGEASGREASNGHRYRSLRHSATSDVRGRHPPDGRPAAVVGIVRSRVAGERSDGDDRCSDPDRGTVPEARAERLRRLYEESSIQTYSIYLVRREVFWANLKFLSSHGESQQDSAAFIAARTSRSRSAGSA